MYKTVKGNHARGTFNQRQIDVVFNEIIPNQNINIKEQSLGIITPYRLQKYDIPIIRMKTTGSEEERVLQKKLLELLKVEND